MSEPRVEELESRWTPSAAALTGTDGADAFFLFGQGTTVIAVQSLRQGQAVSQSQIFQNVSSLNVQLLGGNDFVYSFAAVPVQVYGGDGNDVVQVDGGEGGATFIDGGAGNDQLVGGKAADTILGNSGDDVIIGNAGLDVLSGGAGDDLVISDAIDAALTPAGLSQEWFNTNRPLNERIRSISRIYLPVADNSADLILESPGFDFVPSDSAKRFRVGANVTGRIWSVSNVAQFEQTLGQAQAGDQILLSAGTYSLSAPMNRNLAGITLTGAGTGKTIIRGTMRLDNQGNQAATLIESMTFDLTGQSAMNGYLAFAGGSFTLDDLEVTGLGVDGTAAVAFVKTSEVQTAGRIVNSHVHDVAGDGITTSGESTDPLLSAGSLLEIFDSRGERAGSRPQDQVLTGHFGFRVVDLGGIYSDAAANVIAPDSWTDISLYGTRVSAGQRSGNVQMTSYGSTIDGAYLVSGSVQIGGRMENTTVVSNDPTQASLVRVRVNSAIVRKNTIIQPTAGLPMIGVQSVGGFLTLTDNTFIGWNGNEWTVSGGMNTVARNTVL
jgi:hypothetical protein